MKLREMLRTRRGAGPEGVAVRVKPHNRATVEDTGAPRPMPALLRWGVLLAATFYLLAHFSSEPP